MEQLYNEIKQIIEEINLYAKSREKDEKEQFNLINKFMNIIYKKRINPGILAEIIPGLIKNMMSGNLELYKNYDSAMGETIHISNDALRISISGNKNGYPNFYTKFKEDYFSINMYNIPGDAPDLLYYSNLCDISGIIKFEHNGLISEVEKQQRKYGMNIEIIERCISKLCENKIVTTITCNVTEDDSFKALCKSESTTESIPESVHLIPTALIDTSIDRYYAKKYEEDYEKNIKKIIENFFPEIGKIAERYIGGNPKFTK